jgi:hypothetical protein
VVEKVTLLAEERGQTGVGIMRVRSYSTTVCRLAGDQPVALFLGVQRLSLA